MCEIASPCSHMKVLANRYVDGSLTGILLAYVKSHLATCTRCQRAVEALSALRSNLAALRAEPVSTLGDDRWAAIRHEMGLASKPDTSP